MTVYIILGLVYNNKYIKEPISFWNYNISSLEAISLDLANLNSNIVSVLEVPISFF